MKEMKEVVVYFEDFKSKEDALMAFRNKMEENYIDEFGNWVTDEAYLVACNNEHITTIIPYEVATYSGFGYEIYNPLQYEDYDIMEADIKNYLALTRE